MYAAAGASGAYGNAAAGATGMYAADGATGAYGGAGATGTFGAACPKHLNLKAEDLRMYEGQCGWCR